MPNVVYRANLSSQSFPLLSTKQGRTVIIPQADNTDLSYRYESGRDRDPAVPQMYYGHNIMPTVEGYQSIDYVQKCINNAGSPVPVGSQYAFAFPCCDITLGDIFDIAIINGAPASTPLVAGRFGADVLWTQFGSLDAGIGPDRNRPYLTKMTVNGKTYALQTVPTVNSFRYTWFRIAGVFFAGTYAFIGAPAAATIRGICSANGYGIIWTEAGIFWSASTNPLDFTPSLVTGAGGGSLQQAKGIICYVAPAAWGAIVYCAGNAVAMIYTGNTSYPFTLQEIKGSGGYVDWELVAADTNSAVQFAYTTAGLQSLTATLATNLLTDIEDFLSARIYEDFDDVGTFAFTTTLLAAPVYKKFTLINSRFLVVSYGKDLTNTIYKSFTYAIIYDIELKRYGKLKITHSECYPWTSVADATTEQLIGSIAFLQAGGQVQVVRMYHDVSVTGGCILLGKYQYIRARNLALDTLSIENVEAAQTVRASTLYSIDGKNQTEQIGVVLNNTGNLRQWAFDAVGINHSILLCGAFDLNTIVLEFHTHGRT